MTMSSPSSKRARLSSMDTPNTSNSFGRLDRNDGKKLRPNFMPRLPDVPRLAPASWAGRGAWKSASRVARWSKSREEGFGGAHYNGSAGASPRPRLRTRLPERGLQLLVDV